MNERSPTAGIAGGGLAGLAAAALLRRAGWQVEVFEAADGFADTGAVVGLGEEAVQTLDSLGVEHGGAAHGPRTLCSRSSLLRGLAEGTRVRFGTPVRLAELHGYELVLGADGQHSGVRGALFGDRYDVRRTGVGAWQGTVELHRAEVTERRGAGSRFTLAPSGPGRAWCLACTRSGDGTGTPRERFAGWPAEVTEALERIGAAGAERQELYHQTRPLPAYVGGHVALLGDAAHTMLPALDRGANEALLDAAALAEAVRVEQHVARALRRYDRQRRAVTQRRARAALREYRAAWLAALRR